MKRRKENLPSKLPPLASPLLLIIPSTSILPRPITRRCRTAFRSRSTGSSIDLLPPRQRPDLLPAGDGRGAVHDLCNQVSIDGVGAQYQRLLGAFAVGVVARDRGRTADADAVGAGLA